MQLGLPFLEDSTNLAGGLTLRDEPLLHSGIAFAEELLGSCGLPLQFWVPGRPRATPARTHLCSGTGACSHNTGKAHVGCFLLPGVALSIHRHWLF